MDIQRNNLKNKTTKTILDDDLDKLKGDFLNTICHLDLFLSARLLGCSIISMSKFQNQMNIFENYFWEAQ